MNWSNIVKQTPVTTTEDSKPIKKVKSHPCIKETEIVDYDTLFNLYYNETIEDLFFDFKNDIDHNSLPILNVKNPSIYTEFYQMILDNTSTDFKYLNDNSDVEDEEDYFIGD